MFIKSKRIRLMMIAVVLLLICTAIGVTVHKFNTKMINGLIDIGGYELSREFPMGKGELLLFLDYGLVN